VGRGGNKEATRGNVQLKQVRKNGRAV